MDHHIIWSLFQRWNNISNSKKIWSSLSTQKKFYGKHIKSHFSSSNMDWGLAVIKGTIMKVYTHKPCLNLREIKSQSFISTLQYREKGLMIIKGVFVRPNYLKTPCNSGQGNQDIRSFFQNPMVILKFTWKSQDEV